MTTHAAPGVESHPGPFFAWHRGHFTDEIAATLGAINAVIEEDGPYDGVIGFSEGAALAASTILSRSDGPPPFKFAVFICSALTFAPSKEIGVDETSFVSDYVKASADFFGLTKEDVDAWPKENRIHLFAPISSAGKHSGGPTAPKIGIPTLHLLGAKDPFLAFGQHLVGLCDEQTSRVVTNDCGHELPRSEEALSQVASLFEDVCEMSRYL